MLDPAKIRECAISIFNEAIKAYQHNGDGSWVIPESTDPNDREALKLLVYRELVIWDMKKTGVQASRQGVRLLLNHGIEEAQIQALDLIKKPFY